MQITDDFIHSLGFKVHDWFVNHPLGTTDEGYDHFMEWFVRELELYSNGYMNYN